MSDIRPVDLPELRVESLLAQSAGGRTLRGWLNMPTFYGDRTEWGRKLWRQELERLSAAELYYVSPDMMRLALAASTSMPSFIVQPEDLPSPTGLIVFGEEVQGGTKRQWVPDAPVETGAVRAVLWSILRTTWGPGVFVTSYVDRDTEAESASRSGHPELIGAIQREPRLSVVPDANFSAPFGERGWRELPSGSTIESLLPVLLATWLLMRQPLARVSRVEPDRAARKRLRRAGQEPASTRVIELRRPQSSGEHGDGNRDYHHQWIVRGHWRQHWHPKRQVHRPVWIAPHIKGPEGAPLIGGEKVYAWKR